MINAGTQTLILGSSNCVWKISKKKRLKGLTLKTVKNWSRLRMSHLTGRRSLKRFSALYYHVPPIVSTDGP
jgi:hypothetical protein